MIWRQLPPQKPVSFAFKWRVFVAPAVPVGAMNARNPAGEDLLWIVLFCSHLYFVGSLYYFSSGVSLKETHYAMFLHYSPVCVFSWMISVVILYRKRITTGGVIIGGRDASGKVTGHRIMWLFAVVVDGISRRRLCNGTFPEGNFY